VSATRQFKRFRELLDVDAASLAEGQLLQYSAGEIVGVGGTSFLNVKAPPFNAVGDGEEDDSAAINAAIAACASNGGGTVFFPVGTYLCNGAFDSETNSVLKIPLVATWDGTPFIDYHDTTIELLGVIPPAISPTRGSIIKSTKTGTGTMPALLAANPWVGAGLIGYDDLNYCHVKMRNLAFLTNDNPTIHGVRLDAAAKMTLEDVLVMTETGGEDGDNATEPTHSTVGLWTPNSPNFAINSMNRVWSLGFDTAIAVGEHMRAENILTLNSKIGLRFTEGYHISVVNAIVVHCVKSFKWDTYHPAMITSDIESSVAPAWQAPGANDDVVDSTNRATGELRYTKVVLFEDLFDGPNVGTTGCAKLRLVNMWSDLNP
jgi:hypothetical protein